jgi:hypothetical protein
MVIEIKISEIISIIYPLILWIWKILKMGPKKNELDQTIASFTLLCEILLKYQVSGLVCIL